MTTNPRDERAGAGAGLAIRALAGGDPEVLSAAFTAIGWNKPVAQYERYLREQSSGTRDILVAEFDGEFAGYLTINWEPSYPPFRDASIPEIQDLNVLPDLRRRGIASRLLDEAESRVAERIDTISIGFGMYADYGAAQRLYVQRGYLPDGRGLVSNEQPVPWGEHVTVDDDLALYLTKRLDGTDDDASGVGDGLVIRALEPRDPQVLEAAFAAIGWNKQASRYERYLTEQADGTRDILVAELEGVFAGYGTVPWQATYAPFRDASIPEVQDLNVLTHLRRRGVASRLVDEAESRIAARGDTAGIGVGMTENYGAAQRMYVLRGYVPDGRGLMYNEQPVEYFGPAVIPDDDLVLYLTKHLDR